MVGSSDDSSSDDTGTSASMSSDQSSPDSMGRGTPAPDLLGQAAAAEAEGTAGVTPAAAPEPLPIHQKRSFFMRLRQRAVSRSDPAQYELVYAHGHLRIPGKAAPAPHGQGPHGHRRKSHGNLNVVVVVFSRSFVAVLVG